MHLNAAYRCFLALTALLSHSAAEASCSVQTHPDGVHVDCSSGKWDLQSLRKILSTDRVVSLDLSHSGMSQLPDLGGLSLSDLLSLDISNNDIYQIPAYAISVLAPSLQKLDFGDNSLTDIKNGTFSGLRHLKTLRLSGNPIERLELDAFQGMGRLTSLDLGNHLLGGQERDGDSFPPGVFKPLVALQSLRMDSRNIKKGGGGGGRQEYPDGVFGDLVSLEYLAIYTFSRVRFGPDFARLTLLSTLEFVQCGVRRLDNDSFAGFHNSSALTVLIVSGCRGLTTVEVCAFCHLPSLRTLRLNDNGYLKASYAFEAMYGLRNQSLDEVDVSNLGINLAYASSVDRTTARYLATMCIRRINARNSRLVRITSDSLYNIHTGGVRPLATCLQHVDVSHNFVMGDHGLFFSMFTHFRQLRTLRVENQQMYSLAHSACLLGSSLLCGNHGPDDNPTVGLHTIHIDLPPNMSYINMSAFTRFYRTPPRHINFTSSGSLETLDMGYGLMSPCLTTFLGLGALRTLVLDGNYCYRISDTIFDHLPALRRLSLASVHLQGFVLSQRLLRHLPLLENLDVSRNCFQRVPIDLDLHPDLTDLDLTYNSIPSLTSAERDSLDGVAARHGLRLSLRGNPLLCACSNLDFIRWLWDTPVLLDGEGNSTRRYICTAESGEITDTERVMMDMDYHWRQCIGQHVFGFALSGFFLQLLALVSVYLLWRSWTYVRYCWLAVKRLRLPRRQDFSKDVYVVYADQDAELACLQLPRCLQPHGVRLLLRDLHDLPGSVKADNVVANIDNCWKVLLLVTEAFSRDEWSCGFSVHQAQRAVTDTRPDRVVVLFLEEPPRLQPMLSLELLLRFLPESNVFHLHRDSPHRHPDHPAWARLAEAIVTSQLE